VLAVDKDGHISKRDRWLYIYTRESSATDNRFLLVSYRHSNY